MAKGGHEIAGRADRQMTNVSGVGKRAKQSAGREAESVCAREVCTTSTTGKEGVGRREQTGVEMRR